MLTSCSAGAWCVIWRSQGTKVTLELPAWSLDTPQITRPSCSKSVGARLGDVPAGGTADLRRAPRVAMAAGFGREERPAPRGAPFRGSQLPQKGKQPRWLIRQLVQKHAWSISFVMCSAKSVHCTGYSYHLCLMLPIYPGP